MTRRLVIALLAIVSAAFAAPVASANDGTIEIRFADSELVDGVYLASARIQFQLSSRIDEALANGLELRFSLHFDIDRTRNWWIDKRVAELDVQWLLRYNAVAERYMLRNENTGRQRSFATVFAALNAMGRVDALPLLDAALLEEGARYRGRLYAQVTIAEYPLSLRYLLFWRNDWRVRSPGYAWSLVQ